MKEKSKRVPLLIMIAVLTVIVVFAYTNSTRKNLENQAYYAVRQNTVSIANEINASVGFAETSIKLTAESVMQSMDSEVIENINEILETPFDITPFSLIEYVLPNGWNTMNHGGTPFDASDREYYIQGIQGKSGTWVNLAPVSTNEVLINFYAPIYYEEKIAGVLIGVLGGDTDIRPLLETTFFGEELIGILSDYDGNIISSTVDVKDKNVQEYLMEDLGVSEEDFDKFRENKEQEVWDAFEFEEKAGNAVGCVAKTKNEDWYVIQIVPATSLANIMNTSTTQSMLAVGCIVFLFLIYFAYVSLEQKRKNKQKIAEYLGIIEVLAKEYSSVYRIDKESGEFVPYRWPDGVRNYYTEAVKEGILWNDGVADYAKRFVREEYKQEFAQKCSLENLKSQLQETGTYIYFEYVNDRDGQQHVHRMIATLLPDSKGRYIVVGFADINEEREHEIATQKALQDAYQSAQAANKAKSTFLFNMSHDIRTPMNAIMGYAMLASQNVENPEKAKEYLAKIHASGNHLLSLINDILDMSRIESGKIQLEEKEINLSEVLHEIKTIISGQIHAKQLELCMDTLDVTDEDVYCDKTRLNQVLLNLLSNAIKFTEPGGKITVRVAQIYNELEGKGTYRICVKDTGIGMSQDFVQIIFEPFERERTSTVSRTQGTGLGMAITKKIIDMMGGTIEVVTEKGKGTEFIITLTLRLQSEHKNVEKIKELEGLKALVVDDDYNTCDSVTKMLSQIGMRTEWTLSGKEAVLRSKHAMEMKDAFHAYIIDWRLPDMNGIEVTRQIRRKVGEQTPIIILTAYDWSEIEGEARDAGVTAFCAKPMFLSDLRESLLVSLNQTNESGKNHMSEADYQEKFKNKRILLVEDNEMNREIAVELLEEYGFSMETAENGAQAVEMVAASKAGYYDLILMDIQMPVMDGYEATRRIRALKDPHLADIVILAMTANAFEEDKQEAIENGMNGFLTKPIDIKQLLEELDSIIENKTE